MTRLVVLEALDRSNYVASQVPENCAISELREKFAAVVGAAASDLLIRKHDAVVIDDDTTAEELCSVEQRGAFLTVEQKVSVQLRLLPEAVDVEAESDCKGPPSSGEEPSNNDEKVTKNGVANGVHDPGAVVKNDADARTETASVWLSCPTDQLISIARDAFTLNPERPLRLFLDGTELELRKSLEDQHVIPQVEIEVQRHLRGEKDLSMVLVCMCWISISSDKCLWN